MSGIIKISEAANLGMHALMLMASEPLRPLAVKQAIQTLEVSENHLAKVLQRLVHAGLVTSTRGPKGGFLLSRAPDQITLLDVFEALEGPLTDHTCLLGKPVCSEGCMLGNYVTKATRKFRKQLERTRLSDLAGAIERSDAP
ncbi:MAG TPA: Rrf2 family transcriptional regulator [Myxococcales bacterium]|jgi:Rrf2 family protein